jgi:hypothetical protein
MVSVLGLTILATAFGVSFFVYSYAFVSVGCFLAALISFALCGFFAKLRAPENPLPFKPTSRKQSNECSVPILEFDGRPGL